MRRAGYLWALIAQTVATRGQAEPNYGSDSPSDTSYPSDYASETDVSDYYNSDYASETDVGDYYSDEGDVTSTITSTVTLDPSCPITANTSFTVPPFLATSVTSCGSAPCCTFSALTNFVIAWQSLTKDPVTVGTEVVIIDTDQDITSTTTEIVSTGIVVTLNGETTTLDPALWLNNGTFDGGSDVPTRTTVTTDPYGKVLTISYPTPYVLLETTLSWAGQIPLVLAGSTTCYQNTAGFSSLPSPTFISTPFRTADPTDPKGIFYSLIAEGGQQIPAIGSGICGGIYASELFESWSPTETFISVYSSCLCSYAGNAPVQPAGTVSFLLDSSTRTGRLAAATTPTSNPALGPSPSPSPSPSPTPTALPDQLTATPLASSEGPSATPSPSVASPVQADTRTTAAPPPSPIPEPSPEAPVQSPSAARAQESPPEAPPQSDQSESTSATVDTDGDESITEMASGAQETSNTSGAGDIIASVMGETRISSSSTSGSATESAPAAYTGAASMNDKIGTKSLLAIVAGTLAVIRAI